MDKVFLGIDVGSVTTKFAAIDDEDTLLTSLYYRTAGNPIDAVQSGLRELQLLLPGHADVTGVGTTGSGRQLASAVVGADLVPVCSLDCVCLSETGTARLGGCAHISDEIEGWQEGDPVHQLQPVDGAHIIKARVHPNMVSGSLYVAVAGNLVGQPGKACGWP